MPKEKSFQQPEDTPNIRAISPCAVYHQPISRHMSPSQSNANDKGRVRLGSKIIAAANSGDIDNLKLLIQEADEQGGTDEQNLYAALQKGYATWPHGMRLLSARPWH